MRRRATSIDAELQGIDASAVMDVMDDEMIDAMMRDHQEPPVGMGHKTHVDRMRSQREQAGAPFFELYDDEHTLLERRKPYMGSNMHPFDRRYVMETYGAGTYRLMVEASANGVCYHIADFTVDESDLKSPFL